MRNLGQPVDDFNELKLGDARLNKRARAMVTQATNTPAGTITEVFKNEAAREGAYRLLRHEKVTAEVLAGAAAVAGFARAGGLPYVLAPCDASTLTLPSVPDSSEMGPIGNRWSSDLGAQVMSALLVTPEGVTLGSAGQLYWARERQEVRSRTADKVSGRKGKSPKKPTNRPIGEKETAHWGTVMEQAIAAAKKADFQGQIWFQLDAGADFAHLLVSATLMSQWVTVRTRNPRTLFEAGGQLLEDAMASAASVGEMTVSVRGNDKRAPREATLELKYLPVVLQLKPRGDGGTFPAPLFAVSAREVSPVIDGTEPIEWLLLTNKPGSSLEDAKLVVTSYATRWRIEEVHKAWKSVTKVEDSCLESLQGFSVWATLLFSVAIRIERLKYFSRSQPDAPADVELEPIEIEALYLLRKKAPKGPLTIGMAVRWIADLGGYMPRKTPPGTIVIARGLHYLSTFVAGLAHGREL